MFIVSFVLKKTGAVSFLGMVSSIAIGVVSTAINNTHVFIIFILIYLLFKENKWTN